MAFPDTVWMLTEVLGDRKIFMGIFPTKADGLIWAEEENRICKRDFEDILPGAPYKDMQFDCVEIPVMTKDSTHD